MNKYIPALILSVCINGIVAAETPPATLDDLLEQVRSAHTLENIENKKREERFKQARDKQKHLLEEAQFRLATEEKRGETLRSNYESNEFEINERSSLLKQSMGSLGELHGVVRQISGDIDVIIDSSLVSAQKQNRDEIVDILSGSKELPALDELEQLWLLALDEMVESGKVVTFPARIITKTGNEIERNATRVGVFNAISNGLFLRNLPETGKLIEPGRQPNKRFQNMALELENATSGLLPMPIDPTKGERLALYVLEPDMKERIEQGGIVGYIIIAIGIISVLIALERFIVLILTGHKVRRQLKSDKSLDNPLGRIMSVYEESTNVDTETLGLKLDEAILKEMPKIRRGLTTLALLAAIAPLLGLLGTVTGIIETFQSITLFGTGDPRVMSGGISQALVTTVMGLLVAIPVLLLHSFLSSKSNTLIQILDEKSIALVAELAEANRLEQDV
jgi:biopolymer transport protein ExbB